MMSGDSKSVLDEKVRIGIGGKAAAFDNIGNLWVADAYHNGFDGLFKYDFDKRAYDLIKIIDAEKNNKKWKHGHMIIDGNWIVLFPNFANYVFFYDIDTTDSKVEWLGGDENTSYQVAGDDKTAWMISKSGENVYKYEKGKKSVERVEWISDRLRLLLNGDSVEWLHYDNGDKQELTIYLVKDKRLLSIDLVDSTINELRLVGIEDRILTVIKRNGKYWALLRGNFDVCEINKDSGQVSNRYFCDKGEFIEGFDIPYIDVQECFGELLLVNAYSKRIMRIDRKTRTIGAAFRTNPEKESCIRKEGGLYNRVLFNNGHVFFIPCSGEYVLECDNSLDKVSMYPSYAEISQNVSFEAIGNLIHSTNPCLHENNEMLSLENFICFVNGL